MKRKFVAALSVCLLCGYAEIWGVTFEVAVSNIPAINAQLQTVIGIPRQQCVALSDDGHVIAFNQGRYLLKSTDRGQSWPVTLDIGPEGIYHNHIAIWDDTLYDFSRYAPNITRIQIIETDNLSIVATVFSTILGYNENLITSGQPSGNPNEMVMFMRTEDAYHLGRYAISPDRGRSWTWAADSIGQYEGGGLRMGMVIEEDSCMALVYQGGSLDIWHFIPTTHSWSRELSEHFIPGPTQRTFSVAKCRDTIWASITSSLVDSVYVCRRQVGTGPVVKDVLWNGPSFYSSSPEFIGYTAMQVVRAMDAVVCWYIHPEAGGNYLECNLYLRIWYNGQWSDELLVANGPGVANLTAPFEVPAAHGKYAYCEFKRGADMKFASVRILTSVTRGDIDRAILDFKEGRKTEQEVLDLIEQYNSGN